MTTPPPPAPAGVSLRPFAGPADLLLKQSDSPFDDFGPIGLDPTRGLPPSSLDGSGGLVVLEDGVGVGSMSWHYTQWGPTAGSRAVMIGISLVAHARGRGIGTAAQRQLVDLLLRHTRTHRIEAATEIGNIAEQRALTKAGFRQEGVIRESMWRDGAFHDSVLYSRLRTDPDPA